MQDLLLAPERRAKAAETQTLRREKLGHLVLTDPAQIKYRWGIQRELHVSDQLQALQTSGRPDAQREATLYNQLAEGKAAQGKFAEAATLSTDDTARLEYAAKAVALAEPGSRCDCPAKIQQRQPRNAKAIETDVRIPAEVIWTGEQHVTLLRCTLCETYSIEDRAVS